MSNTLRKLYFSFRFSYFATAHHHKKSNSRVISGYVIELFQQWINFANSHSNDLISSSVDSLVKTWSPLVWLAPNEKFLPGDVRTFLTNVHAEREKLGSQAIKDIGDNLGKYSHYYQNNGFEDLIYYEGVVAPSAGGATAQNNRKRRNFDKDTSLEYIFELPIDDASENWFLVTNDELGKVTVRVVLRTTITQRQQLWCNRVNWISLLVQII